MKLSARNGHLPLTAAAWWFVIAWFVIAWLAVAMSGCSGDLSPGRESASKPQASAKPVAVKTVSVTEQEVRRTSTQPATIHPYYRAEIQAKVTGYVKETNADIGDFVERGQPIATIDVPEMEKRREVLAARIAGNQAEEQRARARIDLADANIQAAEAKLVQSNSEMQGAEAALAAAEAEFARTSDLVKRQSLQSRVLDEVRKKRDTERANLDAARSSIDASAAEVAVAKANRASAEADLKAAEAQTAIARRQMEELDVLIDYAVLKAPFSGLVTHRSVDPGDLVREAGETGNGEPLFVVSQVDTVRVRIPVPEVDAALVSRGDAVTLTFPSFPDEPAITATVTRLAGDLDPNTRTMLVEAEMPNPERKLLPGMFGQATIELSTKVAANLLPARAVRFTESGEAFVYAVGDDHTVSVVPVAVGLDDGLTIEILSGVSKGQQVVDAHLKRFTDGQLVEPLKN